MNYDNNATRTHRDLLIRVCKLYNEKKLVDDIDRIPLELRPKGAKSYRCCFYKDRAMLKYRLMGVLGFGYEDETDELTTLGAYAQESLLVKSKDSRILTVIGEACSACVQSKYFITNACRGCMARPCTINCPKKAITMNAHGQAEINPELCVNCGICMKVCPYHSIIRMPVPCEEACPVNAIEKDGNGKATIDSSKCILCGKCMRECPFGAIIERSEIVRVLSALRGNKPVVLMIAPAVAGQFVAEYGQLLTALKLLGFHTIVEVAQGASQTAKAEAAEFEERVAHGAPFMTTSCCPSYVQAVKKHCKAIAPMVSTTPTPLHFTAQEVKKQCPDCVSVFVSPCIAKRQEVLDNPLVDMVITCEELGAMIAAKGIDVAACEATETYEAARPDGRGFPMSGGVTAAVRDYLIDRDLVRPQLIDGLTRQNMKLLKLYSGPKGMQNGNFLEVMACEGGCVNGPCTMENPGLAKKRIGMMMK